MKCSTKSSILVNAQRSQGIESVDDLQRNVVSYKELIGHIKNTSDDIHAEDFDARVKDRTQLATALEKVADLKEYGLIIANKAGALYSAAAGFLDNVIRNQDQALEFINSLTLNGSYSGEIKGNIIRDKDGNLKTDLNTKQLNTAVRKFLGNRLNNDSRVYVYKDPKTKNVTISSRLAEDFNNYRYNAYLNQVGMLAESATQYDKNVTDEYKEGLSAVKSVPIISHLDTQIRANRERARKAKSAKILDANKVARLDNIFTELTNRKKTIKAGLSSEMVLTYLRDMLSDIRDNVGQGIELLPEQLDIYRRSLDLVKNARDTDFSKNNLLEFNEIQDEEFFGAIQLLANEADKLSIPVNQAIVTSVKENTEDRLGRTFTNRQIRYVTNLKDSIGQAVSHILGIHHIKNPVVQFIQKIIADAGVKANIKSREENDEIEKLYKAMDRTGFNNKLMYQKDENGNSTGRMTDIFSAEYWKSKYDLTSDRNKQTIKNRGRYMITLNPEVLGRSKSDQTRKELVAELNKALGPVLAEEYIRRALSLFKDYENSLTAFKDGDVTEEQIGQFVHQNSPVERVSRYRYTGKTAEKGSDRFLLLVPKRTDENGVDLGFYDSNFDQITANPAALAFYTKVRQVFKDNQTAMGRFEEADKPPTLAYLGRTVAEHLKMRNFGAAMRAYVEDKKKEYSFRENVTLRKYPKDKITGEYQPHLQMEIHSIPQEVRQRVSLLLEADVEYNSLAEAKSLAEQERRDAIKKNYYKTVNEEVENERSEDLLQSVVMANYATHDFIEKSVIETQLNLAHHLIKTDQVRTLLKQDGTEADDASTKTLKKSIQHYIDVAFYDIRNQTTPSALKDAKQSEGGKPQKRTTSRGLSHIFMSLGRVMVLGWSYPHALLNLGQHYFSNIMKAVEGDDFSFSEMHKGYRDIITKAKDRNLINRLYIVGDIAYTYDQRTIHEQNKMYARTHPMYFQTSAEKINQGATSLAILRRQKVTDDKGNEISLYEALDENGNLDNKYTHKEYKSKKGIDLMTAITVDKIRPAVMKVAGDYISPLTLEKSEWGKLALMFKKFLPELVNDRFHKRSYDYNLKKVTEGRLRALAAATGDLVTGKPIDEVRRKYALAGLAEVVIAHGLYTMLFLIGKAACDTPECKEQTGTTLFALNMLNRLTDDVLMLVNPMTALNSTMSPFAVEGIINDYMKFTSDVTAWAFPGGDDGRYRRDTQDGYERGDLKFMRSLQSVVPGHRTLKFKTSQMRKKLMNTGYLTASLGEPEIYE